MVGCPLIAGCPLMVGCSMIVGETVFGTILIVGDKVEVLVEGALLEGVIDGFLLGSEDGVTLRRTLVVGAKVVGPAVVGAMVEGAIDTNDDFIVGPAEGSAVISVG